MRILAGKAKGHRLKTLKGLQTRPTAARVREAVFNILGEQVQGLRFLDLFAGSGAVGLEALSRGAAFCVFNEREPQAWPILQENIKKCKFTKQALLYQEEAFLFLDNYARKKGLPFDLIYVDPPYEVMLYPQLFFQIKKNKSLVQGGLLLCETEQKAILPSEEEGFRLLKKKKYGQTLIWFYKFWEEE